MFIIEATYKKPLEIVDQFLCAHRDYLKQCYAKNWLLASGPQNPRTGGIIIFLANDRALVDQFISQDPFHQNEIADYRVVEFTPVLHHENLKEIIS